MTLGRARALALLASPFVLAPERGAAAPAPVRIGATPSDSYAEALYAQRDDAFVRAGLTADVTVFSSVGAIAQALLGGAVDVGLADMLQLAVMRNKALPYAFFAGGGLYSKTAPTTALVVPHESPIQKASDLEGRSVAVPALASLAEIVTQDWLAQNGADVGKVTFVELPVSAMIPALARGTVAAAFIGEPFLTLAGSTIRRLGSAMDTIAPSFYISAWYASRAWLDANRETARRLAQAFYETARWANAHRDETALVLANVSKLDVESVRSMHRVTWATSLEPRLMQPVLDAALQFRVIDKPVAATDIIVRL